MRAQEGKEDARELNLLGKQLFREGKLEQAALVWRRAFMLMTGADKLKLAKNLGIAYYELEQHEQAYYFLSLFANASNDQEGAEKVELAIGDLLRKLSPGRGRVALKTVPSDAIVFVDELVDENRYKTPLAWFFRPGDHRFIIEKEGMAGRVKRFTVKEGDLLVFEVTLTPADDSAGGTSDPPGPGPVEPPPGTGGGETARPFPWPWVVMGAGAAMAGAGGYLQYAAIEENDAIMAEARKKYYGEMKGVWSPADAGKWKEEQFDERVVPGNRAAVALFIAGGAAAAGGLVWLLVQDGDGGDGSAVSLVPVFAPGSAGLTLGFSF